MSVAITGTLTAQNSGSGSLTFSLAGIADGSWLLLPGANATSATTLSLAGWTALFAKTTMGSRAIYAWGKIKTSGDTSITITKSASDYASAILVYGTGGDVVANWQVGTVGRRADGVGSSTTSVAPSITTTVAGCMVIAVLYEATNATESQPSQSGTGWTHLTWLGQGGGSGVNIETIDTAYKFMASTGATGAVTNTYTNTQASNGAGVQIAIPPAEASNENPVAAFTHSEDDLTVSVDATTSTDSDGTIASYDWDWGDGSSHGSGATTTHTYEVAGTYLVTLTVTDDDSGTDTDTQNVTVTEPTRVKLGDSNLTAIYIGEDRVRAVYYGDALLHRWGWTVDDLMADSPMYVAHRGLGASYPEQVMVGYDAAVEAGFKALEVSLQVSSDGVFVASHDATTGRVFGTDYTISTTPWSTLQSLTASGQPIIRLETLLDKYAATHVIFVDDKTNSNSSALLSIVNSYPDPQDHFIWKGFRGWSPAADVWSAAGFESWGIYYDDEIGSPGSPHTSVSHFTMLGLNWDANSTNWGIATATGKRVLAHVIGNDSDRTTSASKGATGFMVTNINAMP